jgi:hypothetical protein
LRRKKLLLFGAIFHKEENITGIREQEMSEREKLEEELRKLRELKKEREASLPAHSIRPHQILAIEELGDRIAEIEARLKG